jgi:hypothetical protein
VLPAKGQDPPGYHTVYNVIRAIPEDLKTLGVEGSKAYRDAYELVHRREAERPNQIWQADQFASLQIMGESTQRAVGIIAAWAISIGAKLDPRDAVNPPSCGRMPEPRGCGGTDGSNQ